MQYPFFWLNGDDEIVARSGVVGSSTAAQYQEQGVLDMATAQEAATVVALQTAGYHVTAVPNGVADYQPLPGSPGSKALSVGDVITSVDGSKTLSFAALQGAVSTLAPGALVHLGVHRFGSAKGRHTVAVKLGELRGQSATAAEGRCASWASAQLACRC